MFKININKMNNRINYFEKIRFSTKLNTLSKSDFESYKKSGYFVLRNFLKGNECKKIKSYAEKYYAEKPKYPITLNIHRKDKNFYNIVSNKKLVKFLNFFQKSKIDVLNDQMIYKKKNSAYSGQSWTFHQDNSYTKAAYGRYVILHIFLDDSGPKNGGLIFFSGSHQEPILDFKRRKSHKEKILKNGVTRPGLTINSSHLDRIKKQYKKIDINEKRGTICLMHGHLVHGSYPNFSKTKDRATYSIAFINRNAHLPNKGRTSKKIRISLN